MRIAVVGAGVVGVATTAVLVQRGLDVVAQGRPAGSSSSRPPSGLRPTSSPRRGEARTISITGNVVRVRGVGLVRHSGKTISARQVLPLSDFLMKLLDERVARDASPDALVFPNTQGVGATPTHRGTPSRCRPQGRLRPGDDTRVPQDPAITVTAANAHVTSGLAMLNADGRASGSPDQATDESAGRIASGATFRCARVNSRRRRRPSGPVRSARPDAPPVALPLGQASLDRHLGECVPAIWRTSV